jgi:hypothetical protein
VDAFIALLRELGFNPLRGSASCWIRNGMECDAVVAEIYPDGRADAIYSSEYGNEDSAMHWDGSVSDLESFRQWVDSL